jgi:hypothetical protein
MSGIRTLLFVFALAAQMPLASAAAVNYAVGSCKPALPSFATIQGALNASPSPNVVEVCPGTYNEQIVMGGFPVTVEGITAGNLTGATIAVPAGGLKVSATNDFGQPMYAQVFVQSGGQEVNFSNLTIDGTGNNVAAGNNVAGVFYLGSSGTLNHLTVQNQSGNGLGFGLWLEGGIPPAYVTVENSNILFFDNAGIIAETKTSLSELSPTIKESYVVGTFNSSNSIGIDLVSGLTASVSGNVITGVFEGIAANGGKSTVSENSIDSVQLGIDIETDTVSVTSNTIYNTLGGYGIGIAANSAVAPVTGNTVAQSPIGIFFNCVAGTNVRSNTILDSVIGLYEVPSGAVGVNSYYNVGTINGGGC